MLNKSSAVIFTVFNLLGIGTAFADADMFRIIENFEDDQICQQERMYRSPFAYVPVDPAYLGCKLGDCGLTCKETAMALDTAPVKHGRPVVSEDDY